MKLLLKSSLWVLLSFSGYGMALDEEFIQVGKADKVFAEVEYEEPFLPSEQGVPWTKIDQQLTVLASKLPQTSTYLRSFLIDGRVVWWFVRATLRPHPPETETSVFISYKQVQIMASQADVIQINKEAWQGLTDEAKATLMITGALVNAVGSASDGATIRLLSRYLLHPGLNKFSAVNIIDFFLKRLPIKSPMKAWIDYDVQLASTPQNFSVEEIFEGLKSDLVITIVAEDSFMNGRKLTVLRPEPKKYGSLDFFKGEGPYLLKDGNELFPLPSKPCAQLKYGHKTAWSLPSANQYQELSRLDFLSASFINGPIFKNPFIQFGHAVMGGAFYNGGTPSGVGMLTTLNSIHCLDSACKEGLNRQWAHNVPYLCVN